MSSDLDYVADAGKTMPDIEASYDAEGRLAEQQGMRWPQFDLVITVDCGLEFGPT
jgi:hypothetical protein